MRIFLTGGTGLIGSRLVPRLLERHDQVVLLTRRPSEVQDRFRGCTIVEGNPMQSGLWMDTAAESDAVINLAGENIFAHRWNDSFKQTLRESRSTSTRHVVEALKRQAHPSRVLISASAIGYYGPHGDEEIDEVSSPGNDFQGGLCVAWEQTASEARTAGVRVVLVRIGVVLDKTGGALSRLLTPFRMGLGGPIGSGRQWISWIHYKDLVGIFFLALDRPEAQGPINGTAPQPVTNRDFARALGRALHRPAFLPTPVFGLRMLLGEAADVVASGQRVLPRKALALGYSFRFPTLDTALDDIMEG